MRCLKNNCDVVTWLRLKWANVDEHVKCVSLLVASCDAVSVVLTLSPMKTVATSNGCSGLMLTPGTIRDSFAVTW